jgi:FkbM family methyltransferase
MPPLKPYTRALYAQFPTLYRFKQRIEQPILRWLGMSSEPDYRAFKLFRNRRDLLFLDVGANAGQTINALATYGWQCRVEAFEPISSLAERLSREQAKNPRITVHNFGLSNTEAHATLYIPHYKKIAFDGLASLDRGAATSWLSRDTVYRFDARYVSVQEQSIRLRPLDALDLRPDFIKLDVQGAEFEVLQGAASTLARCRPGLLVENPDDDREIALLSGLGYRYYAYDGSRFYAGVTGPTNTFFFDDRFVEDHRLPLA